MQIKLSKATDGVHKYEVNVDGTTVKFGAVGYSDFTVHKDKNRRSLYLKRHAKREDWTKSGLKTAGFWSKHLLWGRYPDLQKNIKHIENKFGVTIAQ